MAANGKLSTIAQRAMHPIVITRGNNRDPRGTLGNPTGVVAHAFTRSHRSDVNDARAQAHYRAQRKFGFVLSPPFGGIKAWMVAIENRAWPYHVCPGFRPCRDGRAVGEVDQAGLNAQGAEACD